MTGRVAGVELLSAYFSIVWIAVNLIQLVITASP